jgi:putative ABC transport system substrate-binding protein
MRISTIGLIVTLTLSLFAVPLLAGGQEKEKVWRLGLVHVGLDHIPGTLEPFRKELTALGYQEGKNVRLDFRNVADEEAARTTVQAFIRDHVDVIVAWENHAIRAAKALTSEIPIVFVHAWDPVAEGFAKSYSRSGTNLIGAYEVQNLVPKHMELLKELIPTLHRVLVLIDPGDALTRQQLDENRHAAATLKLELVEREVKGPADIERAFASIKPDTIDAALVPSINITLKHSQLILDLAREKRIPLPLYYDPWAKKGAIFTYGLKNSAKGVLAARYVDKILKGARPAELPLEQVSEFELIINLKTARALGLTIPPIILYQATRVIR